MKKKAPIKKTDFQAPQNSRPAKANPFPEIIRLLTEESNDVD